MRSKFSRGSMAAAVVIVAAGFGSSAQAGDLTEIFNPLPGKGQTRVIVYGNTVSSPFGTDEIDLYSKQYAALLAKYLNEIGRAIKNCDKGTYDHNVANIKALEEVAQKDYETKEKNYQQMLQKERDDGVNITLLSKLPESVHQALDDHIHLGFAVHDIPPFTTCETKTTAPPPPPPPAPPAPLKTCKTPAVLAEIARLEEEIKQNAEQEKRATSALDDSRHRYDVCKAAFGSDSGKCDAAKSMYDMDDSRILELHLKMDDLRNRMAELVGLPECPAEPQTQPPPPPPPPARTPTHSGVSFDPPPASYFAAPIGMSSGTLGFDYAHFNPKSGSDGDQWGFTGSALFPLMHNVGIGINAGYDRVTSKFFDLDHWTAGASLVWQIGDVRFGPAYGFQSNSANGFSVDTHNYGGFGEYFATPWLTVGAKGGGFSSDPGSNGYYVGGRFTGYIMPNLALNGMIDHTHFNAFGGSNENDYSINGEYLFGEDVFRAPWPPISIYGGYTRSNFTPGSFHVDTFFIGIKLYTDGNGATTLVDRQRTGTLGWQTDFAALSLRF